jgi:hypothetical protein
MKIVATNQKSFDRIIEDGNTPVVLFGEFKISKNRAIAMHKSKVCAYGSSAVNDFRGNN